MITFIDNSKRSSLAINFKYFLRAFYIINMGRDFMMMRDCVFMTHILIRFLSNEKESYNCVEWEDYIILNLMIDSVIIR